MKDIVRHGYEPHPTCIEGAGAIAATNALANIKGLDITDETVGDDTQEGALGAIASIVGVAACTIDLATRLFWPYTLIARIPNIERLNRINALRKWCCKI